MGIRFEFLRAGCGDSILVSVDDKYYILIDGGFASTYKNNIKPRLETMSQLDLIILTHVHNDHICGLISLLRDNVRRRKVKKIWFNSPDNAKIEITNTDKISYESGNFFNELIMEYNIPHEKKLYFEDRNLYKNTISNIELILLSPTKEGLFNLEEEWKNKKEITFCNGRTVKITGRECDEREKDIDILANNFSFTYKGDIENDSSIAFILKYQEKSFLLLGDADIEVVNKSLQKLKYSTSNPLEVEFVKLSHHGSHNNINSDFLDLIKTKKFVVLTDCSKHGHPDKDSLALILKHPKREKNIEFIFNYQNTVLDKFKREDLIKYSFSISTKLIWEF